MTVRATKFTPEVLLSAPRRSAATASYDGSLLLYTVSTYSFESHSKSAEIRIYDPRAGQSTLFTNDPNASEPTWFGKGTDFMFLKSNEDGTTSLHVGDASNASKESYVFSTLNGPVSNLKIKELGDNNMAVVVSGNAARDGKLFNPQKAKKPISTGKVFTSLFVRQWDHYVTPNRSTLWYATFENCIKDAAKPAYYKLSSPGFVNVLKGSRLETPIGPFGGTDNFDVSSSGILFVAKDPDVNAAGSTKSDPYFIPLSSINETGSIGPKMISVKGLEGASSCPTFSPNGKSAVYLRMKDQEYESDKNRIILVPDVQDLSGAIEIMASEDGQGAWSLSPSSISWAGDGQDLLATADFEGRGALYTIPAKLAAVPQIIWNKGSVTAISPFLIGSNKLLVSTSSLVDNSFWFVLDPAYPDITYNISSNSNFGKTFGLSPEQFSEIWYDGAEGKKVHALVMKPSNFDERNKYPLCYLVHGGPQGAWQDNWSTRWSPAVFAEQGYVVVAPNITGSTGYGQDFVDRIKGQWGGYPYEDLVKGFEHIQDNIPYVDTERSVCLGASYGGFATLWIQGQPLGRKFKALVTHDGVFSTLNQYTSDELWFPNHDFEGTPWENRAGYEKWDPSRFTKNWETPHLIIHNELDYRLPISEGLAAFNVLQQRGVESKFLMFPDENHWVLKPENSLHWHVEVLNWINHYVGLPPYKREDEYEYEVQN
ncbi:MAG: hypothetical protein M4579_002836 [Chaenotheca gracillima]|nr:MAG: hypothetical protein M4579_002836 [Chaenotheca gracillima]